ncbi:hypothetical protein AURDEDRAFT_171750 [Auricularia subglabra TFB-10046 SS5]|nr:hypothetical protein AURDEDRAFT_171750 [Auricularia subglabra TFB-10046 SS5]
MRLQLICVENLAAYLTITPEQRKAWDLSYEITLNKERRPKEGAAVVSTDPALNPAADEFVPHRAISELVYAQHAPPWSVPALNPHAVPFFPMLRQIKCQYSKLPTATLLMALHGRRRSKRQLSRTRLQTILTETASNSVQAGLVTGEGVLLLRSDAVPPVGPPYRAAPFANPVGPLSRLAKGLAAQAFRGEAFSGVAALRANAPLPTSYPQPAAAAAAVIPPPHAAAYPFGAQTQVETTATPSAQPFSGYQTPAPAYTAGYSTHPPSAAGHPPQLPLTQPAGVTGQRWTTPHHGTHGARLSAPQDGHRYAVPTPLPPRRSLLAASPRTSFASTPSPVPGTPCTPLFPAQAGPPMLPPLPTLPRAPPPRETHAQGVVYVPRFVGSAMPRAVARPPAPPNASLAMLMAPSTSLSMPPPPPVPGQSTTRGRKIAPAPKKHTLPTPAAAPNMSISSTLPSTVPASAALRRLAPRQGPAPTTSVSATRGVSTTLPHQHAPAPPMHAYVTNGNHGSSSVVVADSAALVVMGSGPQRNLAAAKATQRTKRLDQPKRKRADVGGDAPPSKRPATAGSSQARSTLDSQESSVPVGHHVQSNNNIISLQRSHALQIGQSEVGRAAPFTAPADVDDDDVPSLALGPAPATALAPNAACQAAPTPTQRGLCLPLGGGAWPGENARRPEEPASVPALASSLFALPAGGGVHGVSVRKLAPVKRAGK